MSENYPPQTAHPGDVRLLLELLNAVIEGRRAVYVSAPITSGKLLDDRNTDVPESEASYTEFRLSVIEKNRAAVRSIVQTLRRAFPGVLIDPTAFGDVPAWTQDDYRFFWASVIEEYVDKVVFVDGWEFSNGCSYEFLVATRKGITTVAQDLKSITARDGVHLIGKSIRQSDKTVSSTFRGRVLEDLRQLAEVLSDR